MEFLGEAVMYPITIYCNNVGAIYLVYNKKISRQTKHMDTRPFLVWRYIEKGTKLIIFV